jgi:hypothetical protein
MTAEPATAEPAYVHATALGLLSESASQHNRQKRSQAWDLAFEDGKHPRSGCYWRYWDFRDWRSEVRATPDGYRVDVYSYDTAGLLSSIVTQNFYEMFRYAATGGRPEEYRG